MSDERTVSADYESMYENAIHHLEEREEAINMLKKDLQEATAREPEELNDWSEFLGEILDKGNYYDIDEVRHGY